MSNWVLSKHDKQRLRMAKGLKNLTYTELAKELELTKKTVYTLTRDDEPQTVKAGTYHKVKNFIIEAFAPETN
ncbi:hypothetical protein P4J23_10900 [Bacillus cereus]|nr:hypothetical protein [Bacillus cereus]